MPNGASTSEEEKIILNGGVAEKVLSETCYTIQRFVGGSGNHFPDAGKLVQLANALEDMAFLFQREVLDQIGFTGPYSHALDRKPGAVTNTSTEIRVTIT